MANTILNFHVDYLNPSLSLAWKYFNTHTKMLYRISGCLSPTRVIPRSPDDITICRLLCHKRHWDTFLSCQLCLVFLETFTLISFIQKYNQFSGMYELKKTGFFTTKEIYFKPKRKRKVAWKSMDILRILIKQNTALLSHRRDISSFLDNFIV